MTFRPELLDKLLNGYENLEDLLGGGGQLCIVHLVRNSLSYVSYKDRKAVAADLKHLHHQP